MVDRLQYLPACGPSASGCRSQIKRVLSWFSRIEHASIKLAQVQDFDGKEKNTEFSGNTPCATFEVLNRSLLF